MCCALNVTNNERRVSPIKHFGFAGNRRQRRVKALKHHLFLRIGGRIDVARFVCVECKKRKRNRLAFGAFHRGVARAGEQIAREGKLLSIAHGAVWIATYSKSCVVC